VRLKAQFWCSNPRLRNPHSKEPSNVCSSGAVYTNLWLRFLAHETLFNQAEVEAVLSRGFASIAVKTGVTGLPAPPATQPQSASCFSMC
jgi:hypothetical protein